MKRRAGLVIAALLWFSAEASAQQVLKLGGPVFPPYYETIDGKVGGALTDKMRLILAESGFSATAELFPAVRLIQSMLSGEIEISMLVRNPALDASDALLRSPLPIGELTLNVYSHAAPEAFRDREALRGKSIAVMRGYGYGSLRAWLEQPENKVTLTEVNNHEAALRLVSLGRVPYALLYDVNYDEGVRALGRAPENVVANSFLTVPAFIYLSKKATPDPEALMRSLMASYRTLVRRGLLGVLPGQERFIETGDGGS